MKAGSLRLSVLLTCLNAADSIGGQLEAIAGQEWDGSWEVVVSDGGSTDGTPELVETFRGRLPGLKVLDASDARGIAHGFNVAAAGAEGGAFLFCEADDELAPGCLAAVGRALEQHELIACRGDVTRLNEPWVQASRDPLEGLQRVWFPPYLEHASSMGLGVRRELFERLAGFDEDFEALQDADFCLRAQLAGAALVYVPEAVVYYRFRSRPGEIYRQGRLYAECFAQLQRKYAGTGGPLSGRWLWPLRGWKPILRALPASVRRAGRGRLAFALGWQVGRLRGSLRHRVLAR